MAIVELTVPAPRNTGKSHTFKVDKYEDLINDINKEYQVTCFCVEVATLGYRSSSMNRLLSSMGINKKKLRNHISDTALKCSHYIYLWRNTEKWASSGEIFA